MPDFDDWIPRTVGRKAVCIASHCDAIGGESYLVEYMSKLPPDEWRSRLWGSQIVAVVAGVRVDPSFVAESARAMQIALERGPHPQGRRANSCEGQRSNLSRAIALAARVDRGE
jgi:hypothetical protein